MSNGVPPWPTGLRLLAVRLAVAPSAKALCDVLNVETSTWSQWETGKHRPEIDAMIRLGNLHDITLDWIYRGRIGGLPSDLKPVVWAHYQRLVAEAKLAEPA